MRTAEEVNAPSGISAVVVATPEVSKLGSSVLDMAAVFEGLVDDRFEIVVVGDGGSYASDLQADLLARAPGLPVRVLADASPRSLPSGFDAARYDLIFVAAPDGRFDVRELNHLMEAVERGADVAAGYRPRRTDGIVRHLQRWGWKLERDHAFKLFRGGVWRRIADQSGGRAAADDLLADARRLGFRVAEVPLSERRAALGDPVAA
jgi:hypothetical protein